MSAKKYVDWISKRKKAFSRLVHRRKGCPILDLPLDLKLYLLSNVPDSQTLFALAKTCKAFYTAFAAHQASLLRSARLKQLYQNRFFLASCAINCLWTDPALNKRGAVELCSYMRETYFSTHLYGPSGESGTPRGMMEQLEDKSSYLRGLMRSQDPDIDMRIDRIGTSPEFRHEASQAVDALHELVDRFWIFWNRIPIEERKEFYDSYLVTRRIVLHSILGMWMLRLLQAESGPHPPLHFYQDDGREKLSEAADDHSQICMQGLFEDVIGRRWPGGHEPKVWFRLIVLFFYSG
ncbi:hypothetical protein TWF730_003741 [Orbilia blumenaviensis]|uniref:F-box domain-containing protein n=1 Tax=Orbilia blumenaviensis TaxID=1796055 RepID=A0AAV9U3C2_9PEZI